MLKYLVVAAVVGAAVAAVSAPAGTAAQGSGGTVVPGSNRAGQPVPVVGGAAIVAAEADPACLNAALAACNQSAAAQAIGNTLVGAFRPTPDLTYEPVLVDRVDVRRSTPSRPFSL